MKNSRPHGNTKYTPEQWDAIFEMIATRLDISLQRMYPPGLPGYSLVHSRAYKDPATMVRLKEAKARRAAARAKAPAGDPNVKHGKGIRYSEEAYTEFLRRLRDDKTAASPEAARKLSWPGLPTYESVFRRRKSEVRAILRDKGLVGKPGCRPGDPRLVIFSDEDYERALALLAKMNFNQYQLYRGRAGHNALPSYQAVQKRAAVHPEFGERLYAIRGRPTSQRRYRASDYEAALERLKQLGLREFARVRDDEVLPGVQALYKRCTVDADFKRRMRGAVFERVKLRRELQRIATRARSVERPSGQLGQLLLRQDAYRIADGFVPRHYAKADRDDIKSDIVTAVLAGEFGLDGIGANARWFINEHFRGGVFTSGKFGSLDEAIFEDSDVALIDTLTTDDYQHIG